MAERVLILGLDGATDAVIDPLLAEGRLPALARLAAGGVRARLRSTCPPVSAPAWVSFLTGKQPGKHGVFNFQNLDPRRYSGFSEALVNSSYFQGRTLLDRLGGEGLRVLAYRIPITYPAWDIPGVLVAGPPVPDRRRAYTAPGEVAAQLGPMSLLAHDQLTAAQRAADWRRIDASNRHELSLLERTAGEYLRRGYEVVIAFTGIPDGLHHTFWRYHDPASPVHDPGAPAELRSIITRWYEEIDAAIGRLVAGLDARTTVIVCSDHGGGPAPDRVVNLNGWLRAAGYLAAAGGGRARLAGDARRMAERARRHLPGRMWLKRHLPEGIKARLRGLRNATGAIDWRRTRAYAVPVYYPVTGIYLNVRGRQPHGTVSAGAEYERLRDELVAGLAGVCDPETGRPVVVGVARREEVYQGPYTESAPDLLVTTAAGYHGGVEVEPLVAPVEPDTLRVLSGSHSPEGIFFAAGPPLRRGVRLEAVSIADVLPTALHLCGARLPDDLDGRVLGEALDPAYAISHPVRVVASGEAGGERSRLTAGEESEMRKFLQGLGYVE